ncbi:Cytochrome c-type biogenesis protein DsbD, protein-disulfide reductase [Methylophaga frappieri]|uniref:Thiol:disulfide interchange protein DsbD n=1 Tax=Methylophaga frappieri (strain ATCC BAA-2434 / DSM 25690 / JAM7) TaxID=754477 RepID=I1YJ67_METFJ|nr:protein-disulfide reductase DsbD [Methylophaga frappieri]AFJ02960.1 Cytochrome c-type biogenesis protein DsbD, protein-disulfide reductase [Methylophaga frappieri]
MRRFFWIFLLLSLTAPTQARESILEQLGFGDRNAPPTVDEAFRFSAEISDANTILLGWQIAEGNYLYKNKIAAQLDADNADVTLADLPLPEGENKDDAYFGLTEVYHHDLLLDVPVTRPPEAQSVMLAVTYQGCSETFGICYPPETKVISLQLPVLTTRQTASKPEATVAASGSQPVPDQQTLADKLATNNLPQILLAFLGLGLLLSLTPCVFPMIPILSSIIVGEGPNISPRRAFGLSLVYVLAMSVTYTIAGVLTGMLGVNLQAWLQNPWVIGAFCLILVWLALSMFGFYTLQLPASLQQKLHQIGQQQRGGKWLSVAVMGLLSGLIVGPCLAPPLAGVLLFISQQADPVLGGAALFALSLGMGIPLMILGTSAGHLLPRAGNWMDSIKAVFGVLLLGLAIWMLSRVIPTPVTMALWSALLIISAAYLGAAQTLSPLASGWQKFKQGVGLLVLASGIILLLGVASGGQSVLKPLQHWFSTETGSEAKTLQFTLVDSPESLQKMLATTAQPVMLDFYADWCTDCKNMEQTTFRDKSVQQALSGYTLLKVDMTDNTPAHQAILKQLKVFGPPTLVFYDANGQEYAGQRLIGHVSASEMQTHLAQINR